MKRSKLVLLVMLEIRVSPPWPTQDYIRLDLPEAVFAESDLLFLSHINPPFPARYTNLPKVQWKTIPGGIAFERVLPNGIKFGASVTKNADSTGCSLQFFIENGSIAKEAATCAIRLTAV